MAESARVVPLRREPQPQEAPARQREPQEPQEPQEPLWREALGRRLRMLRQDRDETLAETAARAGLSPQYLSEIERGRKEPSSEMIAALAGALDTTLVTLTEQVAGDLRGHQALVLRVGRAGTQRVGRAGTQRAQQRPSGPVALAA
ncbi:MAG: helix-turn-helix transcriptional regulator [Streptosporangiaceae bacterium]|jgi:DNA-binding XRE family transcriptional regulator